MCYRHKLCVRPHLSRNTIGFISSVNSFLFFRLSGRNLCRLMMMSEHRYIPLRIGFCEIFQMSFTSNIIHHIDYLGWETFNFQSSTHAHTHTRARAHRHTYTHAHRRKWNNLSRIIFNGGFHSPRLFSVIRSKDCFRILSCKTCGNGLLANNQQPDHHTVGRTIERTMADNQPTVLSMQLFLFTNNFHSTRKLIFSAANVKWHLF